MDLNCRGYGEIEGPLIACFDKSFADREIPDTLSSRAGRLKRIYGLSDLHIRLLTLLYAGDRIRQLLRVFGTPSPHQLFGYFSLILQVPVKDVEEAFDKGSPLRSSGLIDENPRTHFHIESSAVKVYKNGKGESIDADYLQRHESGTGYPFDLFSVSKEQNNVLTALLKSEGAANILVSGQPGCGKTEYVRALSSSLAKPVFFYTLMSGDEYSSEYANKKSSLHSAAVFVCKCGGVLVVDQADSILNTKGAYKEDSDTEWLIDLLDLLTIPVIWICRTLESIPEEARRRMIYHLDIPNPEPWEQEKIWSWYISKYSLELSSGVLRDLSVDYSLNAGDIAMSARVLRDAAAGEAFLRDYLSRRMKLNGIQGEMKSISSEYNLSVINTDISVERILSSIRTQQQSMKKVPLNILLWGPPGTGKTEFVKYIAQSMNKKLILKRASDMIHASVGKSEKIIARVFRDAEKENAILLLDEVDSFIINRNGALRSWEISQTNEILTQMENYKGVMFCCTNLLDSLDSAVMRLFTWKVEFKPMSREQRICLYDQVFTPLAGSLQENHRHQISTLDQLTPGDIYTIKSRVLLTELGPFCHEQILAELEAECRYKNPSASKSIGFKSVV